MFDETLNPSWNDRSRRGLTTLTSFGMQVLAVAFLLALPLLRPQGLPLIRQLSTPITLGQPMREPTVAVSRSSVNNTAPNNPADITFRAPASIPRVIQMVGDDPPAMPGSSGSTIPGTGRADLSGVPGLFGSDSRPILPTVHPSTPAAPFRLSHMSEGNLIRKVQPAYPALARGARVQGAVVLLAVITREGTIENLKVVSGHPMLASAAIEAVSQWRYRPYILNNQPVEVETQITVNFSLAGN